MRNQGLVATILLLFCVIVMMGVVLILIHQPSLQDIDGLDNITGFLNNKTEEASESIMETYETETTVVEEVIDYSIESYVGYNNSVNISYPVISGMDDYEAQEKINNKLKVNAISIVSLYPVSTALQNLVVDCEVKTLDDNYITVLYTGNLVGNNYNENDNTVRETVAKKKTSSNNSSANAEYDNDPYLNGFVDPLAGMQNQNYNNITPPVQNALPNSLPNALPVPSPGNLASSAPIVNVSPTPNTGPIPDVGASNAPNNSQPGSSGYPTPIQGAPIYGYSSTQSASKINNKIFFTNTIDLIHCIDVALPVIHEDLDSLATYARSTDVEFVNIDESKRSEVRDYIRKTPQSKLVESLKESDFRNTELKSWPKHFSYVDDDGNLCFSIKLSTKLGNYAIIKYRK